MLTVFWDSKGIVHHEYMEKGSTINSISYCNTLSKLKARIQRVRPEYKQFLLHHDNARPYCSSQTNSKIERLKFETVLHPPYSPDLAPSDFFLFPKMKEDLKGIRFESIRDWIRKKTPNFYADAFKKWILRLEKCVDLNGDYIEK